MKLIAWITIIVFTIIGCTTLRPIELSQSDIQQRISTGDILRPGDKVKITTTQGEQHELKVVSVSDGIIKGKDIEIPVKDVFSIEKRKTSIGKTLAYVGVFLIVVIFENLVYEAEDNWRDIEKKERMLGF